jgi:hypothetical protein
MSQLAQTQEESGGRAVLHHRELDWLRETLVEASS